MNLWLQNEEEDDEFNRCLGYESGKILIQN